MEWECRHTATGVLISSDLVVSLVLQYEALVDREYNLVQLVGSGTVPKPTKTMKNKSVMFANFPNLNIQDRQMGTFRVLHSEIIYQYWF